MHGRRELQRIGRSCREHAGAHTGHFAARDCASEVPTSDSVLLQEIPARDAAEPVQEICGCEHPAIFGHS